MFSNRKIILIIVLLIALSAASYILLVIIPARLAQQTYDGAKQIGHDISEAFQFTPEITVNNTVVLQQQTPILELATVNQTFQHEYEWTNTWLGSTKKIYIRGSFAAKAGFDLHERFSITVYDDKAIVTLPEPKLLSIESLGDVKFEDEQGIINWVSMEDRSRAMNAYIADARKYAETASFVRDARTEMEHKLTEILRQHGKTVEIRYSEVEHVEAF